MPAEVSTIFKGKRSKSHVLVLLPVILTGCKDFTADVPCALYMKVTLDFSLLPQEQVQKRSKIWINLRC